uniref:DRBM domain-containing protein n=1 Tax=Calidris pygmaea TaxID=425635 RepID=A0A8C3K080_9CHAR
DSHPHSRADYPHFGDGGPILGSVIPVLATVTPVLGTIILLWGTFISILGTVIPFWGHFSHSGDIFPILGTFISILGTVIPIPGMIIPILGTLPSWGGGNTLALPGPPQFCPPIQELVVQKGWRLPEYTVTQESGPAHRKEFTMTCRVERFVEIGSGTSKKLAKRNAAAKMLVRIHNVPMEPREGSEGLRGRAPGCTWDSLRNSAGEKMLQLRSHPLAPMGAGACALLQELSQEQSFAISYLDIGGCSPPAPPTSLSTPPATWVGGLGGVWWILG